MPFDGIVVDCLAKELKKTLHNGRIEKVFQPEKDEIVLVIRNSDTKRIVLSANPSCPRIHSTSTVKENPLTPPLFCMVLRKHIAGGKIKDIFCSKFERIINIIIETRTELGDILCKTLLIELMGRYSNIILLNNDNIIIDCIRHIDFSSSTVREIMPARKYLPPPAQNKPLITTLNLSLFINELNNTPGRKTYDFIIENIKGISPLLAKEILHRAGIGFSMLNRELKSGMTDSLLSVIESVKNDIINNRYMCNISYKTMDKNRPVNFHCFCLTMQPYIKTFDKINIMLDEYYSKKDLSERLLKKKSSLVKLITNNIKRCEKKERLHKKLIESSKDYKKYMLYGELITANIYSIKPNSSKVFLANYYNAENEKIQINLNPDYTPQKNAQKYFKKAKKAKSTLIHSKKQLKEISNELSYLRSVLQMLDNASSNDDIAGINEELIQEGYIKIKTKKGRKKTNGPGNTPLKYLSSDGYQIFVGRNNIQNDRLTLKTASNNDIWLHTQKIPGSHVIIKKKHGDIPEKTVYEAAVLAAYYSKAKNSSSVPVDYTLVKYVKKPPKVKPGMVIYDNFSTITVNPDTSIIEKLKI